MDCLFRQDADLGCHQGLPSTCGKAWEWSLSSQAQPTPYTLLQFWSILKLDTSIITATFSITCPGSFSSQLQPLGKPLVPFLQSLWHLLRWRERRGTPGRYTQSPGTGASTETGDPLLRVLEEGLGSLISQDPGDCSNNIALCPNKRFVLWSNGLCGRKSIS